MEKYAKLVYPSYVNGDVTSSGSVHTSKCLNISVTGSVVQLI